MPAVQAFSHLLGMNNHALSHEEQRMLEAELFTRVCEELKENLREQYTNYFCLMNFTVEMENAMLEENFLRLIIKEILLTEEYTLAGIAYYTCTHEDVVHEIIAGRNTSPSATFFRRVIELHRSVRQDIYQGIAKKIKEEYLAVA